MVLKKEKCHPGRSLRQFDIAPRRNKAGCCGMLDAACDGRDLGDPSDVNSFHRALCFVLTLAQCCALMPVAEVRSSSVEGLRFRWLSGKVLFGFLMGAGALFNAGFGLHWIINTSFTLSHISTVVFYGLYVINMALFLQLATRWPEMSHKVHQIELTMVRNYGYPPRLAFTVNIVTSICLLAALGRIPASGCGPLLMSWMSVVLANHILFSHEDDSPTAESVLSKLYSLHHAYKCSSDADNVLRFFFTNYYPYIFLHLEYNKWLSILIFIVDVIVHFTWNYIDLFLILLGMIMTARFRQFNVRLRIAQNRKVPPDGFWREMREDFNRLSCLMKLVNSHVSKIVLLSFACNLYFICLQLLSNTQIHSTRAEETLYHLSFGYLLLRTVAVSLAMAQVNEVSKEPRRILFTVPTESFNVEAKRLLHQIITDEVAFTGLNFFFVTRKLLLTLAGTVVTYEIVLVQLNEVADIDVSSASNAVWHHVNSC